MARLDSETGIWSLGLAKKNHKHDSGLVQGIIEIYHPNQFADIGCGDGWYCSEFKKAGWPIVHGYEGTKGVKELGFYDDIFYIDLTKVRYVGIDYDLVMCLEVGEHIPVEHEDIFLDNLVRYCSKDLILSWASPGQKGSGHFNCREPEYIKKKLAKYGFIENQLNSIKLISYSKLSWIRRNVRAYVRSK